MTMWAGRHRKYLLTQFSVDDKLPQFIAWPNGVRDLCIWTDVSARRQHAEYLCPHSYIFWDCDSVVPLLENWGIVIHIQHQNRQINLRKTQNVDRLWHMKSFVLWRFYLSELKLKVMKI